MVQSQSLCIGRSKAIRKILMPGVRGFSLEVSLYRLRISIRDCWHFEQPSLVDCLPSTGHFGGLYAMPSNRIQCFCFVKHPYLFKHGIAEGVGDPGNLLTVPILPLGRLDTVIYETLAPCP